MEIAISQFVNPGILDYDDARRKEIARFEEAVKTARFLNPDQKRRWVQMGYLLTNEQLKEAHDMIVLQNLRHLKTKTQLEKLKNKDN